MDGISEKENITWNECEQSLIKDKLGISENIAIKKKGDSKNSGDPIAIVC